MTQRPNTAAGRRGFTLIEMLISTGLVVLMLTLFAQIFATATRTIGDQRAIARTDATQRVVDTTLREDFSRLTYRQRRDAAGYSRGIVPLAPGDEPDFERQRGYWYYSENDPLNDTDDVLQFTAEYARGLDGQPTGYFRGKATPLGRPDLDADGAGGDPPGGTNYDPDDEDLLNDRLDNGNQTAGTAPVLTVPGPDRDQPAFDDGDGSNLRTRSPAAEVAYFVRYGNLYRRELLLREAELSAEPDGQPRAGDRGQYGRLLSGRTQPLPGTFPLPPTPTPAEQAHAASPEIYGAANDALGTGFDWYNDFDVSAVRYDRNDFPQDGVFDSSIHVQTTRELRNGASPFSLGLPFNRFGFMPRADFDLTAADILARPAPGQPIEVLRQSARAAGIPAPFIGRFTLGETSSPSFGYPGTALVNGYTADNLELDRELGGTPPNNPDPLAPFVVNGLEDGPREGDDLLAVNVERFDVEVWDDLLQRFVDIGEYVPVDSLYGDQAPGNVFTSGPAGVGTAPGLQSRPLTAAGAATVADVSQFGESRSLVPYGPAGGPPGGYGPGWTGGVDGAGNPLRQNFVFDTWHPDADLFPYGLGTTIAPASVVGDGVPDQPPLRPLRHVGRTPQQVGPDFFENGPAVVRTVFPPDDLSPNPNNTLNLTGVAQNSREPGTTNPGPVYAAENFPLWGRWRASPRPYDPTLENGVRRDLGEPRQTIYALGSVVYANPELLPYGPFDENRNDPRLKDLAAVGDGQYRNVVGGVNVPAGSTLPVPARSEVPESRVNYQTSAFPPPVNSSRPPGTESYRPDGATNGSLVYRAVQVFDQDDNGLITSGATQPLWPTRVGERVEDGEIIWEAVDNRIGLKRFRVVISARDPRSGTLRQTTVEHSFVE